MQGVPSGRTSKGSTGKHVSLIFVLQHLRQAFSTAIIRKLKSSKFKLSSRHTDITHATLQALRFTVRCAFSIATFSLFLTIGAIIHRWAPGTFGLFPSTSRFLFACCVLSFPAFNSGLHVLAILAAW